MLPGQFPQPVMVVLLLLIGVGCSRNDPGASDVATRSDPRVTEQTDRADPSQPVILFLGDSLTAGYYLDPDDAYPALIQRRLDRKGGHWRAVNAGVSGDTSADGVQRLPWLLRQRVDILVLALGANDALRGQPIDHIRGQLSAIIEQTRAAYPDVRVVLAGMRMPTNYGADYTEAFASLFIDLAETYDAVLIPFLLEGVAGDPDLNLSDGIHPTEAGHRIMADTVWTYLSPLVERDE